MDKKDRLGLRTWIEIDKEAIAYNYQIFRSLISKKTKMLGVVKSNAYGHNLFEFAKELEKKGIDYLAVDSVVEGITLRREGVKIPILILGFTLSEMVEKAVINDLEITVSNFNYFKEIKKINFGNKKVRIHIKVDTGMHRHGFQIEDINEVIKELKSLKAKLEVVGLYTHFASAKNPVFPNDTKNQIGIFNMWREAFNRADFKSLCHACATSGIILFPEAHFDMVRVGIGLYGIWPSRETKSFVQNKFALKPVLSWKTIIGEINNIKAGERIGYDFTEKLKVDSKVAVVPIGYWHGYPRVLSGIGQVLVKGQQSKVLGRICMDIIMIDVTKIKNVKVGDEVTIIGRDHQVEISVDDTAILLDGSSYEFVTRINPLIKRIYK
jgi:alanine racemase